MSTHDEGAHGPSARDWRLSAFLYAGMGLLIGGVLGFIAGGWASCAPGAACEFKADLAGALGTWVGGLGTIGALVFAVRAFRSEEAARRRDEQVKIEAEAARRVEAMAARAAADRERERQETELERELERDQRRADKIRIDVAIMLRADDQVRGMLVRVINDNVTTPVHSLGGRFEGLGPIDHVDVLGPSEVHPKKFDVFSHRRWPELPAPSKELEDDWRAEKIEGVTVSFDLNGRRWVKRGRLPARLAEDE